jgi:hypothetical protein
MSVNLCCPNCGGNVGHADSNDDYKEIWLKSDSNGQPECPHCGAGESMINFERNLFIGVIVIVIPILVYLTS